MPTVPIVSYNDLLTQAKNFYNAAASGNSEEMIENHTKFFEKARKVNPSVVRMSLQQAQNDVFTNIAEDYAEEKIGAENFKAARKNIYSATFDLNRTKDLIDLEKSVRTAYPKTGSKRLAIATCLMDGEELGLANVKIQKGMKKFQYLMRRILKR